MKPIKKNAAGEGLKRPNRADFRVNDIEYEYIARKGRARGAKSFNEGVCKLLLPPGWEKELEVLRRRQRADRIRDHEFFPSRKLREMGIPHKTGRHRVLVAA